MRFNVILRDLDEKRREVVVSSSYCNPIGVVEAKNKHKAAEKLGLRCEEDTCYYRHKLFDDVNIKLEVSRSEVTLCKEEELVNQIKEVLDFVNELYSMYS